MADITSLQQSLINAKKIMGKVDNSDFTKSGGSLPNSIPTYSPNINMGSVQQHIQQPTIGESVAPRQTNLIPKANMNEQKIKNSNLPDVVKQAMINNPIPDIPFNGGGVGLSEAFLDGVKTEMNKQGIQTSPNTTQTATIEQPRNTLSTPPPIQIQTTNTKKITSKNLKSIIKESVKELINETIGLKSDNDENFQFRVGNKIFYGNITSSKTIK